MSLRVLLADESSTIKRVMQLALQDFGVEVKSVPVGLDVIQVAQSFHPDIVFADVLLSKKNGYDVCAELKANSELKHIPVVLMWSGFMELDEQKARFSKADRRLEKPFDADLLRQIVKDLVPATQENAIASYLSFPNLPPIIEDKNDVLARAKALNPAAMPKPAPAPTAAATPAPKVPLAATPKAPTASVPSKPAPAVVEFSHDEDEPEEFEQVKLKTPAAPPARASSPKSEDWAHQDLNKFKIDLPSEAFAVDESDLTKTSIALSSGVEEINLEDLEEIEISKKPAPSKARPNPSMAGSNLTSSAALAALDPMHVEEILRQEVRTVLESIAWKIIPDVAERVVREELQKLLKDAERL